MLFGAAAPRSSRLDVSVWGSLEHEIPNTKRRAHVTQNQWQQGPHGCKACKHQCGVNLGETLGILCGAHGCSFVLSAPQGSESGNV